MTPEVDALVQMLDLEPLEVDLFRGQSPPTSLQRVFGGQVAAQALAAAGRTVVPERGVHSLHAYFLRPGDPARPILYDVERLREGRSFSTRRVLARQHGRPIFVMSASFQVSEPGLDHQDPLPDVPDPEGLPTMAELMAQGEPTRLERWWTEWAAFDLRVADPEPQDPAAVSQIWLRTAQPLPDDPLLHSCVLTYVSDLTLLTVALGPHGRQVGEAGLQVASLDHAMWFHRPFRADGWLLYDQRSPSASGARGLATGRVFTREGTLAASVVQEGLIREHPGPGTG